MEASKAQQGIAEQAALLAVDDAISKGAGPDDLKAYMSSDEFLDAVDRYYKMIMGKFGKYMQVIK